MSKLQGDKYTANLVTDTEYRERKDEVQRGMLKVHAYAKGNPDQSTNHQSSHFVFQVGRDVYDNPHILFLFRKTWLRSGFNMVSLL